MPVTNNAEEQKSECDSERDLLWVLRQVSA